MIDTARPACVPSSRDSSRMILLADDSAVLRASMGHRVDAVGDGAEAVEAAAIRRGSSRRPRVVAVSAQIDGVVASEAGGIDAVLEKPLRAGDLARLLGPAWMRDPS